MNKSHILQTMPQFCRQQYILESQSTRNMKRIVNVNDEKFIEGGDDSPVLLATLFPNRVLFADSVTLKFTRRSVPDLYS